MVFSALSQTSCQFFHAQNVRKHHKDIKRKFWLRQLQSQRLYVPAPDHGPVPAVWSRHGVLQGVEVPQQVELVAVHLYLALVVPIHQARDRDLACSSADGGIEKGGIGAFVGVFYMFMKLWQSQSQNLS
jgi:hypothetical protein